MPSIKQLFPVRVLIGLLMAAPCSFGQSSYHISVLLPQRNHDQAISINIDDGKTQSSRFYVMAGQHLEFTGPINGTEAVMKIQLYSSHGTEVYKGQFLFGPKDAILLINPFLNPSCGETFSLTNLKDVSEISRQFDSLLAPKRIELKSLAQRQGQLPISTYQQDYESLKIKIIREELAFIQQHLNSYYSFWVFQRKVFPDEYGDPDQLMKFYSTEFPLKWRETNSGKSLERALYGRVIFRSENIRAPLFHSVDIQGHPVVFSGHSTHYTLVDLWATWCVPCAEMLPALKEISQTDTGKLKIISISVDKEIGPVKEWINKNGITWTQIFGDPRIITQFAGQSGIPLLYLIDKKGIIIYNRLTEADNSHLDKLKALIKSLE